MNTKLSHIGLNLSRFDQRHVRLVLALLGLVLFAISGGAPAISGDAGG